MGLESHVDRILIKSKIIRGKHYEWSRGLALLGNKEKNAEKIMQVLDESGEFGPSRYNKDTDRIELGVHEQFYDGDRLAYDSYFKDFKNWIMEVLNE